MDNFEERKLKEAEKRVKKVKGFYSHLASYAVMSAFFLLLNFFTSRETFWAIYPMLGWGIGLTFHAIGVFGMPGIGKDWEEKQLRKELQRLEDQDAARKWYAGENQDPSSLPEGKNDMMPEEEKLILKEMRKEKEWRDSDFV